MMPKGRKPILILLLIFFAAVEFPGILLVGERVHPMLFGLPFLYGYLLCCWTCMFLILLYAWRTRWGIRPFFTRPVTGNRRENETAGNAE